MSAPYRRLSVSMATAGRQQFAVNCRRIVVLQMSGPFAIRLEAEGNASIPINRPGKVVDCQGPVGTLYVDLAADQVVAGGTIELLLADTLVFDLEALGSGDAPLTLIERWQGIDAAHTQGKLAALKDAAGHVTTVLGASHTSTTQYSTVLGQLTARHVLGAPAGAWAANTPAENVKIDVMAGLDPTNATPAALLLARPEVWRLDIPIRVASIVNTGVVGSGDEARVHAGFIGEQPAYGNGTHWPGPGIFFVTKRDTQTWKAVIAAGNRVIAFNRQEYWQSDLGISYLVDHLLTIVVGWQATGAVLVQWAIDGVIVAERTTRLAALLDPADFTSFGGAAAYRWCTPGVSCTAPLLNDTVDVYHAFGPGWQLCRGVRTLTPGQLVT